MSTIERPFKFGTMENVQAFSRSMSEAGVVLPVSEDLSVLKDPFELHGKTVPNRLCIHPCEGFDSTIDGAPTDLIFRRYGRYARGGSGMIWFEAIAVSDDGRCSPYEMVILPHTLSEMKRLVDHTNEEAIKAGWPKPYNVIQLTHAGRSAKDRKWNKIPLIAFENPLVDKYYPEAVVASDERLEQLEQEVIDAAVLSAEAGFDAVDIKLCHNYIMRELLAGFTRPGKYGGSFENRTRFLFNVIDGIRARCGDSIEICARLNAYDCIPYPYGWGMKQEEGVMEYDLTEPIRLLKMLVERGIRLFDISTMMPRFSPFDRGYLQSYEGTAVLNPYKATATLLQATHELKQAAPETILVATGLTWFSQFGANVGAGGVKDGWFDLAGFGRQAMAYPDYARDILEGRGFQHRKCCITCDKCYELINLRVPTGCVVRDAEVYAPIYQKKEYPRKEDAE